MVSYSDAGDTSKGDHTGYSATYSTGPLKVMYANEIQLIMQMRLQPQQTMTEHNMVFNTRVTSAVFGR